MSIPLGIPGVLPLAFGLWLWARWLGRRYPEARHTRWLQVTAIALPVATVSGNLFLLRRAFVAIDVASAAERASEMARAVTWAMRVTQAGVGLLVLALLLLAIEHARLSNKAWRGPPLGGPDRGDDAA